MLSLLAEYPWHTLGVATVFGLCIVIFSAQEDEQYSDNYIDLGKDAL